MKNILYTISIWLIASFSLQAQDKMPQAISYQAVVRDAQGKVVSEKTVAIEDKLLIVSPVRRIYLSKTQRPANSKTEQSTCLIGKGKTVSGTYAPVDWRSDTYFLQLSMDLTGGNSYTKVSTTQMLPVPYALYAAKAGEVENGSGNGEATIAKYLLISEDDSRTLTAILNGNVVEKTTNYNSEYGFFYFEFNLLYLRGINQQLSVTIENWPIGSTEDQDPEYSSIELPSTTMGRFYRISRGNIKPGTYSLKMIVKDKDNVVLGEYPFSLEMKNRLND